MHDQTLFPKFLCLNKCVVYQKLTRMIIFTSSLQSGSGFNISDNTIHPTDEFVPQYEPEQMHTDVYAEESKPKHLTTTTEPYFRTIAAVSSTSLIATTATTSITSTVKGGGNTVTAIEHEYTTKSPTVSRKPSEPTGSTQMIHVSDVDLVQTESRSREHSSIVHGHPHVSRSTNFPNLSRPSLMSRSTAFVPYGQSQINVHSQNTAETYLASAVAPSTRIGWNEFGFGRVQMTGSMLDYGYSQTADQDLVNDPIRRLGSAETDIGPAFLLHGK